MRPSQKCVPQGELFAEVHLCANCSVSHVGWRVADSRSAESLFDRSRGIVAPLSACSVCPLVHRRLIDEDGQRRGLCVVPLLSSQVLADVRWSFMSENLACGCSRKGPHRKRGRRTGFNPEPTNHRFAGHQGDVSSVINPRSGCVIPLYPHDSESPAKAKEGEGA
jgi:hypothetical protein